MLVVSGLTSTITTTSSSGIVVHVENNQTVLEQRNTIHQMRHDTECLTYNRKADVKFSLYNSEPN